MTDIHSHSSFCLLTALLVCLT